MLIDDFSERFHELKAMEFPSWLTQPLLVDLSGVPEQRQQELCELQQDEVVKTLQDKRNHDVPVRGMRNELTSLNYFDKA